MKFKKLYGSNFPTNLSDNPELSKYLLSMGAGMMNQPSLLASIGHGMQAGNMSLVEGLQKKQDMAEKEKLMEMQSSKSANSQIQALLFKDALDQQHLAKSGWSRLWYQITSVPNLDPGVI